VVEGKPDDVADFLDDPEHTVGSGALIFKRWELSSSAEVAKNPSYFREIALLARDQGLHHCRLLQGLDRPEGMTDRLDSRWRLLSEAA
jgi:hypothetical protein